MQTVFILVEKEIAGEKSYEVAGVINTEINSDTIEVREYEEDAFGSIEVIRTYTIREVELFEGQAIAKALILEDTETAELILN